LRTRIPARRSPRAAKHLGGTPRAAGFLRPIAVYSTLGLVTADLALAVWLAADRLLHNAALGLVAEEALGGLLLTLALHPAGARFHSRVVRALARRRTGRILLSLINVDRRRRRTRPPPAPGG
jgi:hypothetical protein